MPLPQDERILSLSHQLLEAFDAVFGLHPGFRPAHAKGALLSGSFTPSPQASQLAESPHFSRPTTPVTVRFSNSTGLPFLPDSSPDANPRGMAVRFHLAEHVHTDLICHSVDSFPTPNAEGFLALLKAVAASGPDVPSPKPIEQFLAANPAALAFIQAPKPFPTSFATETYYGVNAYAFTNAAGDLEFGRYRITPELGNQFLSPEQVSSLSPNFHFDEIVSRLAQSPVRFHLRVQLANPDDPTHDSTIHWSEDRRLLSLGTLEITAPVPDNATEQQHIIFDPIPRIAGIAPSPDPLLEVRAALYLISGRRRRTAPATTSVEPRVQTVSTPA